MSYPVGSGCSVKGIALSLLLILSWVGCAAAQTQTPAIQSSSQVQYFPVKTVQIHGNTLLPEEELAALVTHLPGDRRTLGDLEEGAAAIQQAYRKAGYGGVVAFVPEQELHNGEIVIRIVEGKVATDRDHR